MRFEPAPVRWTPNFGDLMLVSLGRSSAIRGVAIAASLAVLGGLGIAPAEAQASLTNANSGRHGLFGAQDPSYDGVFRQGLSILGLRANHIPVPTAAVKWLLTQQCADAGFQAFRPSISSACLKSDPINYRGEDTNSTALAVAALSYVWQASTTSQTDARLLARKRAIAWLAAHQNPDGGWAYYPGGTSDANSTGLVLAGLSAAGVPSGTRHRLNGSNALHFLAFAQLRCSATSATRGGIDWQAERPLVANGSATAQSLWGLATQGIVAPKTLASGTWSTACVSGHWGPAVGVAQAADSFLTRTILAHHGFIPSPSAATIDTTTTAFAVLGLIAMGHSSSAVVQAVAALKRATAKFVVDPAHRGVPGSLAVLLLVAHASGSNPSSFGGVNLGSRLLATLTP